ncbi:MAG: aminotransferase class I/II-fold pyridoxal phosphate-dependent enzyme [Candidatus Thermoplasmatota archaeon]|nr:aminotransferase class I/II-fold pyridoxal phosphate-dependent enzyme [Candidatus Thermoplasmatota archaeon]
MSGEDELSTPLTAVAELSDKALENANSVLKSGQLFRYGENTSDGQFVAKLETEFAKFHNTKFSIGVNSGGSAMYVAMLSAGVTKDDVVLLNSFTLAPVPGALQNIGCKIELVEINENLTVDIADLESKIKLHKPKAFLLSHMRGHFGDLEEIQNLCEEHGVLLIEDCAHTLGGEWNGKKTGTFGIAGCFSLQTYKQINAGEGGIIVTNDEDLAAKAILYSGSYGLHHQNGNAPSKEVFAKYEGAIPNFSLRLNELAAAVSLPQLDSLESINNKWNDIYSTIQNHLQHEHIRFPDINPKVKQAPTSIQFFLDYPSERIVEILKNCENKGLKIKWFGAPKAIGFTSTYRHWTYLDNKDLSRTDQLLAKLCDIRLPSTLTSKDCETICSILLQAIDG